VPVCDGVPEFVAVLVLLGVCGGVPVVLPVRVCVSVVVAVMGGVTGCVADCVRLLLGVCVADCVRLLLVDPELVGTLLGDLDPVSVTVRVTV